MSTHLENTPLGNRVRSRTENSKGEAESTCQSLMHEPRQTIERAVRENPATATLAAFGIGLSLGAVVGCLLADRSTERQKLASSLGSRMLDSVSEYLPDSIQKRFCG